MKSSTVFSLCASFTASLASSSHLERTRDILRADDVLHKSYASLLTKDVLPTAADLPPPGLFRRQQDNIDDTTVNSTAPGLNGTEPGITLNSDGSLDFTAWSRTVNPSCVESLSKLRQSTNPSGSCVCYNILSLELESGRFEADLRLFEVSEPREGFAGVRRDEIRVFLDYDGAQANGTNLTSAEGATAGMPNGAIRLNQVYRVKGQIDQAKLDEDMSISGWEIVLMPVITLRSTLSSNTSTAVSLNEASFLAGVFSTSEVRSDFAAAQLAVDDALAALANGTAAFILPGTQIMIFPVGLVITGSWLLIGLSIYGFGTFERMQYRDQYRSRSGRKASSNVI